MEDKNIFGERLRELRKARGLQQAELGKVFDLSPSAIGSYERGLREPSYEHLISFANYFNVSTDYMLGRSEEKLTVEAFLGRGTVELFELLNKQSISIHGRELSEIEKRRIGDIAVGLFWSKFTIPSNNTSTDTQPNHQ